MSKEYEKPLTLKLHSSAVLKYYLICVHILAVFAVFYATLNTSLQIMSLLFITAYYFYQNNKSDRVKEVVWLQDNNWKLYEQQDTFTEARLTPESFLSSWLVILAFKAESGKRVNILVPYDAVDKESFRRLKLRITILKPKYLQAESTNSL
ncbi:MAG: hypothetical protein KAQ67_01900 [Gammaproteobacteria bacterium]|nr:hypothetical protein [Gammaproteobacteria bacterium]